MYTITKIYDCTVNNLSVVFLYSDLQFWYVHHIKSHLHVYHTDCIKGKLPSVEKFPRLWGNIVLSHTEGFRCHTGIWQHSYRLLIQYRYIWRTVIRVYQKKKRGKRTGRKFSSFHNEPTGCIRAKSDVWPTMLAEQQGYQNPDPDGDHYYVGCLGQPFISLPEKLISDLGHIMDG